MDRQTVEDQREPAAPAVAVAAAPASPAAGAVAELLALQRTAGNRAARAVLARQPAAAPPSPAPSAAPAARTTVVAIMGADRAGDPNQFYTYALRYWRAHRPGATFVTGERHLAGLLDWIKANVPAQAPLDELVIVSHANEDGTLSFGLDGADADGHLSFPELRDALKGGKLPDVGARVDARTHIRIKGCDIGRSKEMLDLVDQAFGGAGEVSAPTHEQGYEFDPIIARDVQRTYETRIRTEVEAANPMPAEVPKPPKGATRDQLKEYQAAVAERAKALKARTAAIAAGIAGRRHEALEMAEKMGTVESFSGPMFQRPGDKLFTAAELQPQIDSLYPHLSKAQRESLAQRLVAPDRRGPGARGTFGQAGQRIDRREETVDFPDPQTVAEARALYDADFRSKHFVPSKVAGHKRVTAKGGFRVELVLEGRFSPPDGDAYDGEWTASAPWDDQGNETVVPDDATLTARARARTAVPGKYTWSVTETRSAKGIATRKAVGVRVFAYLHHGSLDASPHDHFTRPESDPAFFAKSTYAPPPPPPPKKP